MKSVDCPTSGERMEQYKLYNTLLGTQEQLTKKKVAIKLLRSQLDSCTFNEKKLIKIAIKELSDNADSLKRSIEKIKGSC